ncbi:MAG: hypothetical protein Q8R53_05135 [Nanoarchaeota archaeon]|nr:hypothetical protein [Nanoarchaeota archaeon]
MEAEAAYLRGFIRGVIQGRGLEAHTSEIFAGMTKSYRGVTVAEDICSCFSPRQHQQICRAENDALLQFALEYVERWGMYHWLFNGTK